MRGFPAASCWNQLTQGCSRVVFKNRRWVAEVFLAARWPQPCSRLRISFPKRKVVLPGVLLVHGSDSVFGGTASGFRSRVFRVHTVEEEFARSIFY